MSQSRRRTGSIVKIVSLAIGLFLPTLSLIPLGSLWLWQHGWLLHWALGAALVVAAAFACGFWLTRDDHRSVESAGTSNNASPDGGDPGWTMLEQAAWQEVQKIAAAVDVQRLTSRDAVIALALDTIRAVAGRLHPEVADPIWRFTVPEAFGLIEQVSKRLGTFALDSIPLSDRLTVAQLLALYRWRKVVGLADKAYDVWRLIRLGNPITAATHEMRERVSRQMLAWGHAQVTERLARAYVTEVGRAAIDLYGGRLRLASADLITAKTDADLKTIAKQEAEPLRVLVAGNSKNEKSNIILRLAREAGAGVANVTPEGRFAPIMIHRSGFPVMLLIDAPPPDQKPAKIDRFLDEVMHADLVLWVVAVAQLPRHSDRRSITAIRERFAAFSGRRPPSVLAVISHMSPESDVGEQPQSIPTTPIAVSNELGVPSSHIVSVYPGSTSGHEDLDALWARISSELPTALHAQITRRVEAASAARSWRRTWSQLRSAGRTITGVIRK